MTIPTSPPGLVHDGPDRAHRPQKGTPPTRPGWIEVGVAAAVYSLLWLLAYVVLHAIPDEDALASGLVADTLSGVLGIGAFAAAWAVRIRNVRAFGVRRVRWTWLLAGAGLGLVAAAVGNLLVIAYRTLSGDTVNVQTSYQAAAAGGPVFMIGSLLLGGVGTAIGEELAFRGVLTNALGRYGAWVAVLGSAIVFAIPHGFNAVLIAALVNGSSTPCSSARPARSGPESVHTRPTTA